MRTFFLPLILCVATHIGAAQSSYSYIDINNTNALISGSGNHFWDFSSSQFFIPKDSMTTTVFTSTLWIGGKTSSGSVHLAAERFRQFGQDFFPGPISDSAVYYESSYQDWERVWKVNRVEILQWLADPYNATPPQSVLDWPAHGDTTKGQSFYLAPFVDVNQDGHYDPVNDFDHPKMYGDQMIFYMFNDDANVHTESGGTKLGIEVHGVAYAFDCPQDSALDKALFFKHWIHNRSNNDYVDVYIGLWNDFDLGNAQDDYLGCDPLRNLFYAYNGDNEDQSAGGAHGYGLNLPSQGVRILQGPLMPANGVDDNPTLQDSIFNGFGMNDGIIDNERLGMFGFLYHNNAPGPVGDPTIATDYYNMMRATWKDGTPMTYGGNGYNPSDSNALRVRFMFPDSADTLFFSFGGQNPDSLGTGAPWSEAGAGNTPGDRRGMGSIGEFELSAGSTVDFDHVYVFGQKHLDRLGAIDRMKHFSDQIQEYFEEGSTPCSDFEPEFIVGQDAPSLASLDIFPNPAHTSLFIKGMTSASVVKLINLQGQIVDQVTTNERDISLEIVNHPSGVYILQIENDQQSLSRQVLKL